MTLSRTTLSLAALALLGACASTPPAAVPAASLKPTPLLRVGTTAPTAEQAFASGRQALDERRPASALAWFGLALAARPDWAAALNGRAVALARLGHPAAAVPSLEQAVRLEPQALHLHANLARVLAQAGEPALALQHLEQAQRLKPDDTSLQALADALRLRLQAPAMADAPQPTAVDLAQPAAAAQPHPFARIAAASASRWVEVAPAQFELQPAAPQAQAPLRSAHAAQPAQPPVGLEISNGSGERGLARRTARHLATQGTRATRITNHVHFRVPQTQVEFLPAQQAAAEAVARALARPVTMVATETLAPGVSVRVVLGRDARSDSASARQEQGKQVAAIR